MKASPETKSEPAPKDLELGTVTPKQSNLAQLLQDINNSSQPTAIERFFYSRTFWLTTAIVSGLSSLTTTVLLTVNHFSPLAQFNTGACAVILGFSLLLTLAATIIFRQIPSWRAEQEQHKQLARIAEETANNLAVEKKLNEKFAQQLKSLQKQLVDLQKTVPILQEISTQLGDDAEKLNNFLSHLQQRVSEMAQQIRQLQTTEANLKQTQQALAATQKSLQDLVGQRQVFNTVERERQDNQPFDTSRKQLRQKLTNIVDQLKQLFNVDNLAKLSPEQAQTPLASTSMDDLRLTVGEVAAGYESVMTVDEIADSLNAAMQAGSKTSPNSRLAL